MKIGIFSKRSHLEIDDHIKAYKSTKNCLFIWHNIFTGLFVIRYSFGGWCIGLVNTTLLIL